MTLFLVLALLATTFGWRLADLQLTPDAALAEDIGSQVRYETVSAPRGDIVDRYGRTIAMSLPRPSVVANPRLLQAEDAKDTDRDLLGDAVRELSGVLSTDADTLRDRLSREKFFVNLERQVDPAVGEAVLALGIPGVYLEEEQRREHPNGDCSGLAVVGRVDVDQIGISGLERDYDEHLTGEPGRVVRQTQGGGAVRIPGGFQVVEPMTPGEDLVLTLDRNIQFDTEQLLIDAVEESGSDHGTAIVSDPHTGEILAMANVIRDPETGEAFCTSTNLAVTWAFEPGSINKALTFAAVFEHDAWPEFYGVDIPRSRTIALGADVEGKVYEDRSIQSEEENHPPLWILRKSSNNGTIIMAEELGAERFEQTLRDFGLGEPTALDLKGEASGILGSLDANRLELPSVAIGQSVAVTAVQMLQAYNTLAAGGLRVDPVVVKDEVGTGTATRVVSEEAADTVMGMLRHVVLEGGTGTRAALNGYTVSGKTGTAWQPCGVGYDCDGEGTRHLTTSFAGVVGNDEGAQLSAIVVLDNPESQHATGGGLAAPVFAEIMRTAVHQLRIPPHTDVAPTTDRVRAAAAVPPPTDASLETEDR
ncbi:MAG: penicillin-binding protein 2 [Acidimicrobiales bacterium]|nr:penicillin-binding protein 2 [Acidimicrobiales bacterium]